MAPRYRNSSDRQTNEVMRDLNDSQCLSIGVRVRQLWLSFRSTDRLQRGNQTQRKGLASTYTTADLAYANEAEKSSDVVTASFIDDEYKNQSRMLVHCLKTRDDAPFQPFFSRIEALSSILHCDEIPSFGEQGQERIVQQAENLSSQQDLIDKMLDL